MNGNTSSPVRGLRDELERAQDALQEVQARVGRSRLLRFALGKFYIARLEDAQAALFAASTQVSELTAKVSQMGKDSGLVRDERGRLRKRGEGSTTAS